MKVHDTKLGIDVEMPRYIVYEPITGIVHEFNSITEAFLKREKVGGLVYEPIGLSDSIRISEEDLPISLSEK